jgi:5-deoxy-glucuronate isomerase
LQGGCEVRAADADGSHRNVLRGRTDVFAGATDVLYVGKDATIEVSSADGGRFAICSARASSRFPVALVPAEEVPVEVRGAGNMTRLVRNFGAADAFMGADSLIACEVITPGGNWSSYPAHKHDQATDSESRLEEIYYYEIAGGAAPNGGFGFHRTSASPGTDPARPVDTLVEVRDRDVVLVPSGWHGPCAAAPGHDMYYLNVMAGPGTQRAWNITDHPDQAGVRGTWAGLEPDPRVTAQARAAENPATAGHPQENR